MQADNRQLQRLYPAGVQAFLEARLGAGVHTVERIERGEWSKAFTFRAPDGAEFVARFSQTDEDFLKDRRAMSYASTDLPVPRIVEIGEAFDRFYAISERAHGTFIDGLDDRGLRALLPSLLATWDAARQVDLSRESSGYGGWSGDGAAPYTTWREAVLRLANGPVEGRVHGWEERLARSPVASRAFEAALRRVEVLVDACPNERHLVHSDLLNFNVLAAGDRVTAVLDWGSSLYGDFLWDLAWFTLWQPWYPAWAGIDFRLEATRHYAETGVSVPDFEERMRCYELCIGLDGMAYPAFRGYWNDLDATAARTRSLVNTAAC